MPTELSQVEARRLFLRAQGLLGAPDRRAGVTGVLERLGAVQLDTISVLARSHELVPYARLGAVGRAAVEAAYWSKGTAPGADGSGAGAFEYWAHAACVLPLGSWPRFAFRRRAYAHRRAARLAELGRTRDLVLARLRDEGPLTATDLGGAKNKGPWWDWSEVKVVCEDLLATGAVVCVQRRGWRRIYDLAERAIPPALLADDPDDDACYAALVAAAAARLGVATRADLADYFRLRPQQVDPVAAGLTPVTVQGWREPAWADPALLAAGAGRGRHRTTLLSPFDSLVWDRARTARVFGFAHRLEAYVPKDKRQHGYFVMPLLAGGRLLGRVDPAREGRTLVAHQVVIEPRMERRAVEPLAAALREAAAWVGCDDVRVEIAPPPFAAALHAALAIC